MTTSPGTITTSLVQLMKQISSQISNVSIGTLLKQLCKRSVVVCIPTMKYHMYTNTHAHTYTGIDTYTQTHTNTHTCTHTYIHTRTSAHTYTYINIPYKAVTINRNVNAIFIIAGINILMVTDNKTVMS